MSRSWKFGACSPGLTTPRCAIELTLSAKTTEETTEATAAVDAAKADLEKAQTGLKSAQAKLSNEVAEISDDYTDLQGAAPSCDTLLPFEG